MSAPEPDFDSLLSDHLDGRLDQTQMPMLEQRLRSDRVLRSKFDALQADRQALRKLFSESVSASRGLSPDFAKRVLAESRLRGLETTASLPKIASQRLGSRIRVRLVMGALVTAAAVLIVISVHRVRTARDGGARLAQNQATPSPLANSAMDLGVEATQSEQAQPELGIAEAERRQPPPATGEAATGEAATGEAATGDVMPSDASNNLLALSPKPSREAEVAEEVDFNGVSASGREQSPTVSMAQDPASLQPNSAFTAAMLVYDVHLTSQGRQRGVVARAIQRNGLGDSHRKSIDRDVLAAAKQANKFDDEATYQVIYLQAPAKKVDRVFLDLLQNQQDVLSVSLTLVTDTPLLQIAGRAIQVNATHIKHDQPLTLELGGDGDDAELETLRGLLSEQMFMPLDSTGTLLPSSEHDTLSSSGDDVISRVLILVR